jgi:hypothetical protein
MKFLLAALFALSFCAVLVSVSAAEHATLIPPGVEPASPGGGGRVPCDITIRYDDGSDDDPGSGPTLGYYSGNLHQFLGVRSTPPANTSYQVQSASWFSDFWVVPGLVDVTVYEWNNPSNSATATVNVTGAGTWEVEFTNPICVPAGSDYAVMICPQPGGGWGVVGNDLASPDNRSFWSDGACALVNGPVGSDYMIWSCVTPCGPVPAETMHWGQIKSLYR